MISKKVVKHISKLARLKLTEKEIEKMQKELSAILDYVEKLKEVDISNAKPYSMKIENVFRKDVEKSQDFIDQAQKLIEMAPQKKDNFVKVKSIFK